MQCCYTDTFLICPHFDPEDGDVMASETLVSNHRTSQRNNPESH